MKNKKILSAMLVFILSISILASCSSKDSQSSSTTQNSSSQQEEISSSDESKTEESGSEEKDVSEEGTGTLQDGSEKVALVTKAEEGSYELTIYQAADEIDLGNYSALDFSQFAATEETVTWTPGEEDYIFCYEGDSWARYTPDELFAGDVVILTVNDDGSIREIYLTSDSSAEENSAS